MAMLSTEPSHVSSRRSPRVQVLWLVLAALLLGGSSVAGLASAQSTSDPGGAGDGAASTVYTPTPRYDADTLGWAQVSGAVFPDQTASDQATTMHYTDPAATDGTCPATAAGCVPHTVDLYAVSFRSPNDGLAGGAACQDPATTEGGLATCTRVPVIYRYVAPDDPSATPTWELAFRGTSPGFVGGIAWIGSHKALAVGGNGCYPRYETDSCPDGRAVTKGPDGVAGSGRAWVGTDGRWAAVPEADLPPSMTGLGPVASSPRASDCEAVSECAFAGGLGQIWTWRDGAFSETAEQSKCIAGTSSCTAPTSDDFPFRVRSIAVQLGNGELNGRVAAVTSGCCVGAKVGGVADPQYNWPRLLTLAATGSTGWTVHPIFPGGALSQRGQRAIAQADSAYAVTYTSIAPGPEQGAYAPSCLGMVTAPGAPAGSGSAPAEPASEIVAPVNCGNSGPAPLLSDNSYPQQSNLTSRWPEISSVRLIAAGADLETHRPNVRQKVGGAAGAADNAAPNQPDGIPDWAVGEQHGHGAAVTTTVKAYGLDAPYPLNCPEGSAVPGTTAGPNVSGQCKADPAGAEQQARPAALFSLPSYPLNGFTTVGTSGVSWAVGDRGAILRLGLAADAQDQGAPNPAKVGSGERTRLSNREAYDAFRPVLSAKPGLVPPLAARPTSQPPGGLLTAYGSPNPVIDTAHPETLQAIVMSRDGTEGWALGPASNAGLSAPTTMYHFVNGRWSRCDPRGGSDLVPQDPACGGLEDLANYAGGQGAKFVAVARVPTENGTDQARAKDFEVVALMRHLGSVPPNDLLVRYREGRWSVEREWSRQITGVIKQEQASVELAFATPTDGWLVSNTGNNDYLFHLKDGEWVQCGNVSVNPNGNVDDCLDPDEILPIKAGDTAKDDHVQPGSLGANGLHLTSSGTKVYLYGTRIGAGSTHPGAQTNFSPMILSEDAAQEQPAWKREYDPKNGKGVGAGFLNALSVVRGSNGKLAGWGVGDFGEQGRTSSLQVNSRVDHANETPLIRLVGDDDWEQVKPDPAAARYLLPPTTNQSEIVNPFDNQIVALPDLNSAVALRAGGGNRPTVPMVWLNPDSERWEAYPTPFPMTYGESDQVEEGAVHRIAPDGRGGFWMTARGSQGGISGDWFYRHAQKVNQPVFSEVAHPVREPITATAAGGDGSLWVATQSGVVYRYDRLTGWDRVTLKGWDGGVVRSPAYGIAVGADGNGVIVGSTGRIAEVGPQAVGLETSSVLCSASRDNCATTRTLRSVAVGSDGSALAGGDGATVVWRPSGGSFRRVTQPQLARSARITGIAMPRPDRAWLTADTGDVVSGSRSGGNWSWRREAVDAEGQSLARGDTGVPVPLRAVAIDAKGRGYAVGDSGVILARNADGSWRRIGGYLENLRSVALGPGGKGAVIGGASGLILTLLDGRFEVARHADFFDPLAKGFTTAVAGTVAGVALLPGTQPDQLEAWAAVQVPGRNDSSAASQNRSPGPGALLHYASDPNDLLLGAGAGRVKPVPDAPDRQAGEISLAAFGKSECQLRAPTEPCPEQTGSGLANEAVLAGIRNALLDEKKQPDIAISTGDANGVGGSRAHDTASLPTDPSSMHQRWSELVADPLRRTGIPLYGAIGGQDLSYAGACVPGAHSVCEQSTPARAGLNFAWREAFADAPAPWGRDRDVKSSKGLEFKAVSDSLVPDTATDGTPASGAHTHYAVDVLRDGKKLLRIVVLDTSLKTVGGVALQHPVEDQLTWLHDVLVNHERGSDQLAVVVSETPSYAYESSAGATTDTLADSAAFETVLVKDKVDAVISGRLGWNGLYWIRAPGVHTPCPGQGYQTDSPDDVTQLCAASNSDAVGRSDDLARTLEGTLGREVPKPSGALRDAAGGLAKIPVAVAGSAGGPFGPDGTGSGSGSQGFWRGYTRIRLFPDRKHEPVIEQRPVFDWIGMDSSEHTLTPGRQLNLKGYGREPASIDQPFRYVDIDGPAITHRYDLVYADPAKPYLPKVDETNKELNHYVPVPSDVATIDEQKGTVRYTSRGNHPPIYTLAILSVGDKAVSWPVVLAPRRSFKPPVPKVPLPLRSLAPPRVLTQPPASLPPQPAQPIPRPPTLTPSFPVTPSLPSLPVASASAQPPPPPPPPPPPGSAAASALQITPSPVGLNVAPAASVIPPPAPPIQPAPPGGARREARQRQAAVAKSEEGGDAGASEESGSSGGGDANASTRLDQGRDLAFTAHESHEQASAWSRGALYGGGLGMAALILALGWTMVGPGSRRREPELPAPAWNFSRDRRR
jgi:hypothetical protein